MTRHRVFDTLALCGAIALLLVSLLGPPQNLAYTSLGIAVQVVAIVPLVFRRQAPLTGIWFILALAVGMTIVELVAPGTMVNSAIDQGTLWVPQAVAPFVVCGALSYSQDQRLAWIPVSLLFVLALRPWEFAGVRVAQSLLLVIVPAVLGMYIAARDRLIQGRVDAARADERARLAAEMHDVVTHRVSLMVLQAGGLEMTARDEDTRTAAEQLRANGCQALDELRQVVAILREEVGDAQGTVTQAPVPELGTLVSESTAVGVPVELVEEGTATQASPVVRRTAHRIVQEALTNVRKHAPGARVRVHVNYDASNTRVSVHNSAPDRPTDPALTEAGSGSGLNSLRERVSLIGGTLDAGPVPEGGFHVEATLKEPAR